MFIAVYLLMFSFISCTKDDYFNTIETHNSVLFEDPEKYVIMNGPYSGSCSFPYDGQLMSLTPGNYTIYSDQIHEKKYTWRMEGDLIGNNPSTRLQFKIKINSSYPVIIRVIGIQSGNPNGDIIESCYLLDSYGSTKSYDINPVRSTKNWLNIYVGYYKYYQFEVIVQERNATGNPATSIPVQISLCRSGGGSCSGYPSF